MSYFINFKHTLPAIFFCIFALSSCHKSENFAPILPSNYNGATPGLVNLTVTPYGSAGTALLFEITGGTANIPIACSYYIFDYLSSTAPLISSANIYFGLNDVGSFNLEIESTQCSLGTNTGAYITWQCYISASPYTVLPAINEGGNAFFFNCPV